MAWDLGHLNAFCLAEKTMKNSWTMVAETNMIMTYDTDTLINLINWFSCSMNSDEVTCQRVLRIDLDWSKHIQIQIGIETEK